MHYSHLVKLVQAEETLDEDWPDKLLWEVASSVDLRPNLLIEIEVICKLHDDAKMARRRVDECLFVANDEWALDWSEDSHFI